MGDNPLLCPCTFSVPLAYNDGRPVEPETMLRVHAALTRQFESFTIRPAAEGTWRGQTEMSVWFDIAITESRVEELKTIVAAIGKELGQKQMYFQVGPPSVSLLDIDDATPPLPDSR